MKSLEYGVDFLHLWSWPRSAFMRFTIHVVLLRFNLFRLLDGLRFRSNQVGFGDEMVP